MMKLISSQVRYYEINLLWKTAFVQLTNAQQQHSIHMSHKVLTKIASVSSITSYPITNFTQIM
jgi:hypothetical protein